MKKLIIYLCDRISIGGVLWVIGIILCGFVIPYGIADSIQRMEAESWSKSKNYEIKMQNLHQEWCDEMGYDFSYDLYTQMRASGTLPTKPKE